MTRFQISLLLLALAASPAFAQNEVRRTGVIGAEGPPRPLIQNYNGLDLLKLLPDGYSYTFNGEIERKRLVVRRMSLQSPDGNRQLTFARMEGSFTVGRRPLPSGKLYLEVNGVQLGLEQNKDTKLDRYLDETVQAGGPGAFKVRGWSITKTEGSSSKRSFLLDGVDVQVKRKGLDHVWAERVYDEGQTVLLASIRSVQSGIKRRFVEVNRPGYTSIYIPPFAGSPDYGTVKRTGVLGSRRPPTVIENCNELQSIKVFRDGYAYVMDGAVEKEVPAGSSSRGFVVEQIALESPNRRKTLSLVRFEGTFEVRQSTAPRARLVLSHEGVDHTVEENPGSNLERYLGEVVRAGGPGAFKVRGWLITRTTPKSTSHSTLLDGIEVSVEREQLDRVWAERVYDKGKTVLIESTGSVQLGIKRRFVEVLRHAPRAGLANALSGSQ